MPKVLIDAEHQQEWIVPRRVMCAFFWVGIILVFTGIILLVTSKHKKDEGEEFQSWGGILLGLGFCLLLICLILCMHAYCVITVAEEATPMKRHIAPPVPPIANGRKPGSYQGRDIYQNQVKFKEKSGKPHEVVIIEKDQEMMLGSQSHRPPRGNNTGQKNPKGKPPTVRLNGLNPPDSPMLQRRHNLQNAPNGEIIPNGPIYSMPGSPGILRNRPRIDVPIQQPRPKTPTELEEEWEEERQDSPEDPLPTINSPYYFQPIAAKPHPSPSTPVRMHAIPRVQPQKAYLTSTIEEEDEDEDRDNTPPPIPPRIASVTQSRRNPIAATVAKSPAQLPMAEPPAARDTYPLNNPGGAVAAGPSQKPYSSNNSGSEEGRRDENDMVVYIGPNSGLTASKLSVYDNVQYVWTDTPQSRPQYRPLAKPKQYTF